MRIETFPTGNKRRVSKSRQAPKVAQRRSTAVRAIDLSAVPPLRWWRHLPADTYSGAHLVILRRAISGITFLNEPSWPDAVRGDAAATIGIALRTAKRSSALGPAFDLVMSAVLITALAGDPAARLMINSMINRHNAEDERSRLAPSWLGGTQETTRTEAAIVESTLQVLNCKTAGA